MTTLPAYSKSQSLTELLVAKADICSSVHPRPIYSWAHLLQAFEPEQYSGIAFQTYMFCAGSFSGHIPITQFASASYMCHPRLWVYGKPLL